jgi:chromosome segregation ATPase
LNQQTATLTQAVDQQKEAIEAMEQSIRDQAAIREDMMKEVESAKKDVEKLQTKIASHDFKLIASEKAGLLEKKINRATNDVMRCFEIATGDAILPDEKNNQCSDLLARP